MHRHDEAQLAPSDPSTVSAETAWEGEVPAPAGRRALRRVRTSLPRRVSFQTLDINLSIDRLQLMAQVAYAVTPDAAPARQAQLTPQKIAAAMRAFFRVAQVWDLSNEQAQVLLGHPARSTFYKWKRGEVVAVSHDTIRRLSYVLGIYKALQVLFKSPAQADGWVSRPNTAFGGGSALDRMLGGDVTDLAAVRIYLDTVRGQGV
jgi:hypothetical protein